MNTLSEEDRNWMADVLIWECKQPEKVSRIIEVWEDSQTDQWDDKRLIYEIGRIVFGDRPVKKTIIS